MHNVRPQEHGVFLPAIPEKLFAERPSLTLKPLAKALSISRLRTISFLALAEETAAAFGCCYLSTPRALHLRGCQAEAVISPGWREPPLCGNFAAAPSLLAKQPGLQPAQPSPS